MLLAAAHETGLITALQETITPLLPSGPSRLTRLRASTLRTLVLTVLWFVMAGLARPWSLRTYTGQLLALLTGRTCAYGYGTVERFVALLARTAAPDALTTMLAQWSTRLWHTDRLGYLLPFPVYLDGHKKPVYSDVLVPRGRIGRTGKILGCRTLTVLHDPAGHPLIATTARGDAHLTTTVPALLEQYETATDSFARIIIIDREGMSGNFLATLVAQQRIVVTILRADQYQGLDSFTEVGPFEPLQVTADGQVLREVARARYRLAVPDHPDQPLLLNVALIRDYRRLPPAAADADGDEGMPDAWWVEDWTPTPTSRLTEPRLIPIVTTGAMDRPETLVAWYTHRWPAQENHFKLWLLPLGLDVNAGFQKTEVVNSEAAKRQDRCTKRATRLAQQAAKAQRVLAQRRIAATSCQRMATSAAELVALVRAGDRPQAQQHADALQAAVQVADAQVAAAAATLQALRAQQTLVAQTAADLAQAPPMFELDNCKDQLMTVFKLCAANLGMWARDQFFPATYAQAGWARLRPFMDLPGTIAVVGNQTRVTFSGFNDRQLNRDLADVCARVRERQPRLPDGTTLICDVTQRRERRAQTPEPSPWSESGAKSNAVEIRICKRDRELPRTPP